MRALVRISFILLAFFYPLAVSPHTAWSAPDRPLVFIPGILGSTLEEAGDIVWGDAFSLKHFRQLKIDQGPKNPEDGLVATGAIRSVQILGPLKVKQYDAMFATLQNVGYLPNQTLFVFPYDWRQSNFTSAEQLAKFVDKQPLLKGKPFDILAHSMGGLVAKIYVSNYDDRDDKRQVKRLVTMGTPFLGAAQMINILVDGWGMFPNWLAGGMQEIREVVLSFPSTYQLMPTYENCCVLGRPDDPQRRPFDILSSSVWKTLGWDKASPHFNRSSLETTLTEAAKLRELMHKPMPEYVKLIMIAGDKIETAGQLYAQPMRDGKFESTIARLLRFPGDGTVIVKSASFNRKTDALTSLSQHATIFEDEHVQVSLERIFGPPPPPTKYNASSVSVYTKSGQDIAIERVNFEVPAVVVTGSDLIITLELTARDGEPLSDVPILGTLVAPNGGQVVLNFRPLEAKAEGSYSTIPFVANTKAPLNFGVAQVSLMNKELPLVEYLLVLPPPEKLPNP